MFFRSSISLVFLVGALLIPISGCSESSQIEVPEADSVPAAPDGPPSDGNLKGEPVKIPTN